jgi:hypothetical protein
VVKVDSQRPNSCSANSRFADKDRAVPTKMARPFVSPRIEKSGNLFRSGVSSDKIWSLAKIASVTSNCQIGCHGRAAMLARNNMVDVEGEIIRSLWN